MKNVCPQCSGSGKIQYTVHEGIGPNATKTEHEMTCILCKGFKTVSDAVMKVFKYESTMWCECDKETIVTFYDDGEHPELSKHHYRCKVCDKVTQIG